VPLDCASCEAPDWDAPDWDAPDWDAPDWEVTGEGEAQMSGVALGPGWAD